MADQNVHPPAEDDEFNLVNYWRIVWKHNWLIGILCFISVMTALIFSLLSSKIYVSTATVLIPREGGGSGLLSAVATSGLVQQIGGLSIPSLTPNRDLFISIVKSRLMARAVVERFKLEDGNQGAAFHEAVEAAKGIPKVSQTKEGVIEISVEHTNPKVAADMANFYVEELDRLVTHFEATAATRQKRFIEEQIARSERDLKTSEETLRQFQEVNRAVLLGDMANSLRLPGTRVPKIGLELGRLTRDLKVQETVYTLLTQQLEQAKIAEARDIPVVQVLDRAVPAIRKSRPKIRQNIAVAGGVSLVLGIFLAFSLEYVQRQKRRTQSDE